MITRNKAMSEHPVNGRDYDIVPGRSLNSDQPLVRLGPADSEYERTIEPRPALAIKWRWVASLLLFVFACWFGWIGGATVLTGIGMGMLIVWLLS